MYTVDQNHLGAQLICFVIHRKAEKIKGTNFLFFYVLLF